jgi:signal transduction histidine kinase
MSGVYGVLRRAADSTNRRPTIRVVLFVGFGLTLGLWLFAGFQFTRQMAAVEAEATAVNIRYMRAQELLATVRAQILLGSVYVRDSLLSSDPAVIEDNRRRLAETYRAINAALSQYVPVLDSPVDERDEIANLGREIEEYRITMERVLASTPSPSPRVARRLLNEEVVPRREQVIDLSEEVQALNRSTFVRQQDIVGRLYRSTQQQTWRQLGLVLAVSLGIALLAALYSGRLERRIRQHTATEIAARTELQHLSARLLSVQEEERRGIARELHDEVGQALTALKVELAMAQRALVSEGRTVPPIESAKTIADGMLHVVRNLSHLLHPALLDDLGLLAAIEAYARDFGVRYGIAVDVVSAGAVRRLAPPVETAAYRIIQEALTNVARHSQASACRVRIACDANVLEILVEDNGVGFDVLSRSQNQPAGGLGLLGIRERALEAGGQFELDSTIGGGTRLRVRMPARSREERLAPASDATVPITHRSPQWES